MQYNEDWMNNYMSGKKGKANDDKIAKSKKDLILRRQYGLQDVYSFR